VKCRENLFKEASRIGHFVHHGKQQREAHLAAHILDTKAVSPTKPRLNAITYAGTLGAPGKSREHTPLNVQADDPSSRTHHLRQGQAEITHAAADIEHSRALGDVGRENAGGILR
jgi:hypothetical protein